MACPEPADAVTGAVRPIISEIVENEAEDKSVNTNAPVSAPATVLPVPSASEVSVSRGSYFSGALRRAQSISMMTRIMKAGIA
jgi:hypothetical protein